MDEYGWITSVTGLAIGLMIGKLTWGVAPQDELSAEGPTAYPIIPTAGISELGHARDHAQLEAENSSLRDSLAKAKARIAQLELELS